MRTISAAGLALLKSFEECRLVVYADAVGNPTVGWGHLVLPEDNLKLGDVVTQDWADAKLMADLRPAELEVIHYAGQSLNDAQFSALVDFTYNLGSGAFSDFANLHMRAASWAYDVAKALPLWDDANGHQLEGLLERRVAEAAMFCGLLVSRP